MPALIHPDDLAAGPANQRSSPAASRLQPRPDRGDVEGEGFVAVRKVDAPRARKGKQAPSHEGPRRRGRPPKRQQHDAAEIASLQDLAAGES